MIDGRLERIGDVTSSAAGRWLGEATLLGTLVGVLPFGLAACSREGRPRSPSTATASRPPSSAGDGIGGLAPGRIVYLWVGLQPI
jgi:hypothetical protein